MKKQYRWTASDIPDQTGRIAVVTGASAGLGFEAVLQLAKKKATVIMAIRSIERGQRALDRILKCVPDAKLSLQLLDLGSLDSVKKAAKEIKAKHKKLDILINNAGTFMEKGQTKDGFESRFGVNHLGHFAFTLCLLDTIMATPASRIVNVSSVVHHRKNLANFDDLKTPIKKTFKAYGRSKLAGLLFTYELQRRLQGTNTIAVAAHPGISYSEITRYFPRAVVWLSKLVMQSTSQGALPILRAATDPSVLGGQFYGPHKRKQRSGWPKVVTSSQQSYNIDLQKHLWTVSEELTGIKWETRPNS